MRQRLRRAPRSLATACNNKASHRLEHTMRFTGNGRFGVTDTIENGVLGMFRMGRCLFCAGDPGPREQQRQDHHKLPYMLPLLCTDRSPTNMEGLGWFDPRSALPGDALSQPTSHEARPG